MLTGSQFTQLTRVLDDLPDLVIILNREGVCLYANRPAAFAMRRQRADLVGRSWRDLGMSPQVMEPVMDSVRSVFATGESVSFEIMGVSSEVYEVVLSPFRPDDHVTAVVAIAHNVTELHHELDRTRLLQDVAVATTSSMAPEDMGAAVLAALKRRLDLYKGDIRMLDEHRERLSMLAYFGYPPETVQLNTDARVSDSPLLTAEAFRQQRVLTHEDENLTPERLEQLTRAGVVDCRYLVAPLIAGREVVGTMAMTFKERRPFTDDEMDLLSSVVRIVAQGVSVIRTANVERRVSQSLQRVTLILPKRIDGVRFSHAYQASSDEAILGGDFYHIFPLGEGLVGLFIGDISGKGIKVADVMIAAKNTLRAAMHEGLEPGEVLAHANTYLVEITEPNMFATAFVARLDTRSGGFEYANGGHPPALLRRADGSTERLEATGSLVGAFPETPYETRRETLGPDDVLVLYTDGVIEAKCADGLLGDAEFARIVAKTPGDARQLAPAVVAEVTRRAGGRLHDDVALLAVSLAGE